MTKKRNKIDFVPDEKDMHQLAIIAEESGHSKSKLLRISLKILIAELRGYDYKRPTWFNHVKEIMNEEEEWVE